MRTIDMHWQFFNKFLSQPFKIVQMSFLHITKVGKTNIVLKPNDTICGSEKLFQNTPYYYNGECYGFVMPKCLAISGPVEIGFEFLKQTEIFLHHEGQFLSPNSRSRVNVNKGQYIKIAGTDF